MEYSVEAYRSKELALSNALLQAKEKTSLFESKIEYMSIYKLHKEKKTKTKIDASGNPFEVHYTELEAQELRGLLGKTGGSLYSQLEVAAVELKRKLYIYRDIENREFKMDNLYGECTYSDGIFMLEFNPATEHLFLDVKSPFTKIPLSIIFSFTTNGGFQLYKLLRSYLYDIKVDKDKSQEEQEVLSLQFPLQELRLQLGYVDLDQPEIVVEGSKKNPDFDKIAALDKKPKYKRFADFSNHVLKVGMEEINKISDIYIKSIEGVSGARKKTVGVKIELQHNINYYKSNADVKEAEVEENNTPKRMDDDFIDDFVDSMREFIKEDLKTKEIKAIAEASDYNLDKIKEKYEMSKNTNIKDNFVGWMISAITNDYQKSTVSPKQNSFNYFEQRTIDFEALERDFLANK